MKFLTAIAFLCALITVAHSVMTESCLDCFKSVEGGTANACTANVNGDMICGEYNLSEAFYDACKNTEMMIAGWVWDSCAKDDTCARWCIKLYMATHEGTCATDLGGNVADMSCHHYGRIFNGGENGCSDPNTCPYVSLIRSTCYGLGGTGGPEGGDGSISDTC